MSEDTAPGDAGTRAQVQLLETDECWRLLQEQSLARLALVTERGDPEIYPVNIRVDRGVVLVRSAEDAKTRSLSARPRVALEVDGQALRVRWSVIVHGTADVIEDAGTDENPTSWFPGEKTRLIRVTVDSITGKRFLAVAPI